MTLLSMHCSHMLPISLVQCHCTTLVQLPGRQCITVSSVHIISAWQQPFWNPEKNLNISFKKHKASSKELKCKITVPKGNFNPHPTPGHPEYYLWFRKCYIDLCACSSSLKPGDIIPLLFTSFHVRKFPRASWHLIHLKDFMFPSFLFF